MLPDSCWVLKLTSRVKDSEVVSLRALHFTILQRNFAHGLSRCAKPQRMQRSMHLQTHAFSEVGRLGCYRCVKISLECAGVLPRLVLQTRTIRPHPHASQQHLELEPALFQPDPKTRAGVWSVAGPTYNRHSVHAT